MKEKSDSALLTELRSLIEHELALLVEVLTYLQEVEQRELYLREGYSSMFAFCTEYLGYSEGEAHVRIQASRLIQAVPSVEQKIESGEISLTVAAKVQGAIRRENIQEKAEFVERFNGASVREAEETIAENFPGKPKAEKAKPVNMELVRIEFNATEEMVQKFARLKELMAHKNFSGRWDLLFDQIADIALKKLEKAPPFDSTENSAEKAEKDDTPVLQSPQVRRSRYIPVETVRQIYRRDHGRCQYISPNGKKCGSRHAIQIDHIEPYAHGGAHSLDNLRLLCGAHNRWRANAG